MACQINNKSNFDISEVEDLIQDLYSFSQDRFGFKKPASLELKSDPSNTSPLGKTAHYDPSTMKVVIYVDGRHPKDIMRSFAHELVHHTQNEKGMFDNPMNSTEEGYAQKDPHLRKMEEEAYLEGNMCLRDWEDGYKSSNPNILNERRIYKMSTKDWKNKELNGLLNEKWGFSMDLTKLNENQKPDYVDLDKDGDTEEPMKAAAEDAEEINEEELPLVDTAAEEVELDTAEPVEVAGGVEIVDEPQPMDDSSMTLEKIIDEMTIEQLKAALAMKQGDI
tara:strand:- start:5059 stop:5892 length:834 start_codon:yes stop_codon:yes gene_type:complete